MVIRTVLVGLSSLEAVAYSRRGRVVARLSPPPGRTASGPPPWTALRGSGRFDAEPEDSVLDAQAFSALLGRVDQLSTQFSIRRSG
jgi:hypothetical protein